MAKVTPFEKVEEVDIADDNIAQEVFMLEDNGSLDSPPINDIEDNDPLAGLESTEANNDITEPTNQPRSSGLGLRLANFAVDPANMSTPATSTSNTSMEQSWHIAQGAEPQVQEPYFAPQSIVSAVTLPLEPLPPQQVFSSYVVQPPNQTSLTVQFPLALLKRELYIFLE